MLAKSHSVPAAMIVVSRFGHGKVLSGGYHALVDLQLFLGSGLGPLVART